MKRYLVRIGINPLESIDLAEVVNRNLLGGNSGNLIYSNSVYRALMVDDTVEFVCDKYLLNTDDADWINENFDGYIIPLADLFRPNNDKEINRMKNLVKKLNIPCVVIGVGVRAKNPEEIENGFEFDGTAKNFINAVLEKSAMLGLRGEMTAKYFKKLGYVEDRDFMIIGCPSMYTYGNRLESKKLLLNDDSKISVNASVLSSHSTLNFLNKILDDYSNSYFLPQRSGELWNLYIGKEYEFPLNRPMYPTKLDDKIYAENRVKMFVQAKQWMDFLSTADLSIGSRMHGNIAAILAGTPSIIIPHGTRMTELIDYHKLPHIDPKELENCKSLNEVIERVDFDGMHKYHAENFARYKEFLKINGIDTIFNHADYVENAPYDIALSKLDGDFEVKSANLINRRELAARWVEVRSVNNSIKSENQKKLKAELKEVKSQKKQFETELKQADSQKKKFEADLKEANSQKKKFEADLKEANSQKKKLKADLKEANSQKKKFETELKEANSQKLKLRAELKKVNSQLALLNKTSIRTDVKRLSVKVRNKLKGQKQTNLEIALRVKNKKKK